MKVKHCFGALVIVLVSVLLIPGCGVRAKKLAETKRHVIAATDASALVNPGYEADLKRYRIETAIRIARNDSLMAEFKVSLKMAGKETNPYYKNQIKDLEQQNTEMKTKMDNYKFTADNNWIMFKNEFSQDMVELGEAFSALSVKITGPHISRVY